MTEIYEELQLSVIFWFILRIIQPKGLDRGIYKIQSKNVPVGIVIITELISDGHILNTH